MLFKKPEKIEKIDASSITGGLYLKVDANGKIIGATVSGGGGGSLESVSTFAELPSAPEHVGEYYIVDTTTGTWILGTKKSAGIYKSNGTIWIYIDNVPETTSLSDGTTTITGTNIVLEGGTEISTTTSVANNKITIASTGYTKTELDTKFNLKQEVFVGVCAKHPILPTDMVIDNTEQTLTIATVNGIAVSANNPICYYTDGNGTSVKHEQTTQAVFTWDDISGIWYLYFDVNGNAVASQDSWNDFGVIAPIARIYWNATLATADKLQIYAYEAHQNTISAEDHNWKHAQGTIWLRGFDLAHTAIATGAPNVSGVNTCVGLTTGYNIDDNLLYGVVNSTSGALFTQDMGVTVASNITTANSGLFKVRDNDAGGLITMLPATRFPFPWDSATNRPQYISTNGTRNLVTNNYFFVVYIYAMQDPRTGDAIRIVTAPTEFSNITNARASSWDSIKAIYPTINDNEIRPLYRLIYENRNSGGGAYSSTVKYSALREVQDIRKAIVTATTASGTVLASSVSLTPAGGISSSNVQSAIEELDTEKLDKNTAITGATKTKITYDADGLVTSGEDATTADIADSTNKRYVSDANLTVIGNTSGTNTGDETNSTIKAKLDTDLSNKLIVVPPETILNVPSTAYPTIQSALDYLDDKYIGGMVYIQIADGTYSNLSKITITHPQSARITIQGNTTDKTKVILNFTGDGFAWTTFGGGTLSYLTLNGSSTSTGIAVANLALIPVLCSYCNINTFKTGVYAYDCCLMVTDITVNNCTNGLYSNNGFIDGVMSGNSKNITVTNCLTALRAYGGSMFVCATYTDSGCTSSIDFERLSYLAVTGGATLNSAISAKYCSVLFLSGCTTNGTASPVFNTEGNFSSVIVK